MGPSLRRISAVLGIAVVALFSVSCIASGGSPSIVGFGATVKTWDATHVADHRGNIVPGCCFDPMTVPGLRYGDRYYLVQPMSGVVISYEMHLKPASAAQAKTTAMKELPDDAHPVSFTVHGRSCAILVVSSQRLGAALVQDKSLVRGVKKADSLFGERVSAASLRSQLGEAVIEFSSGAADNTYNPSAVNDLLFSSLAVAGSTAQNC